MSSLKRSYAGMATSSGGWKSLGASKRSAAAAISLFRGRPSKRTEVARLKRQVNQLITAKERKISIDAPDNILTWAAYGPVGTDRHSSYVVDGPAKGLGNNQREGYSIKMKTFQLNVTIFGASALGGGFVRVPSWEIQLYYCHKKFNGVGDILGSTTGDEINMLSFREPNTMKDYVRIGTMTSKDCQAVHEVPRVIITQTLPGVPVSSPAVFDYEYVCNKKFYVNKPMYFDRASDAGDANVQSSGSIVAIFLGGGNLDHTFAVLQAKVSSVLTYEDL
ncbi:MAG: hypothetical protein [Circular genetic element sp.]|nr:MAG: hypothetical protein [Circular genetic element sp.]